MQIDDTTTTHHSVVVPAQMGFVAEWVEAESWLLLNGTNHLIRGFVQDGQPLSNM